MPDSLSTSGPTSALLPGVSGTGVVTGLSGICKKPPSLSILDGWMGWLGPPPVQNHGPVRLLLLLFRPTNRSAAKPGGGTTLVDNNSF